MADVSSGGMMKSGFRVLVLDGDCRAALESVMALGREGIRVDVASGDPESLSFMSRYAESKFIQPTETQQDQFILWLNRLDCEREYSLIIPSTEVSLNMVRSLTADDHLRSKLVIPSDHAIETALNKWRTCDLAARLGIELPETFLILDHETELPTQRLPIVLKPLMSKINTDKGYISLSAHIVCNENARRVALQRMLRFSPVLQQEYIRGTGLGIELLYNKGRLVWHFAHERIHETPLTGGGSSYRRSIRPPEKALEWAKSLLNALEWHGAAMVEFKKRPDGTFCLMEINPRLWGSLALSVDAGVNFPMGLLQIATGQAIPAQPIYNQCYYTRNLAMDIEWMKDNLRADHSDTMLLTRPVARSVIEYLRPLIARESWDHFDIKDPIITLTILRRIVIENIVALRRKAKNKCLKYHLKSKHTKLFGAKRGRHIENILFICYGNICRSPFASYLARIKIPGYQFNSTGFHAIADRTSPVHIVEAASEFNTPLIDHRSTVITDEMVSKADLILLMDINNYKMFEHRYPKYISRATMLGLFATKPVAEIADPYDMTLTGAEHVLSCIETAIEGLKEWLTS